MGRQAKIKKARQSFKQMIERDQKTNGMTNEQQANWLTRCLKNFKKSLKQL
jgi:hypothetical protein